MQHRVFTSFLAGLVAMNATASASAQTTYQTVVVENPSHFKVGNHHYDFNVGGLRDYVDSLKSKEPELYGKLDKKLSELESSRNTGWGVFIGGASGGLILALLGASSTVESAGASASTGRADTSAHPAFYIGLGLIVLSPLGFLIMPKRRDYLRFINQHNDMDPPSPINLQFGLAPAPGGGQGWLTATF